MHTFVGNGCVIDHNSDYSGEAFIKVSRLKLIEHKEDPNNVTIAVPISELKSFIAQFVRNVKIARLEQMHSDDILLGESKLTLSF